VVDVYGLREWLGWEYYPPAAQRPLRNVLQELAYTTAIACTIEWKTPKQLANEVRGQVAEFEKVLALVDSIHPARDLPPFDEVDFRIGRRKILRAAIAQEIAEGRAYLDKLEAGGGPIGENARTLRSEYWDKLARLWLKTTGSTGPFRCSLVRRRRCSPT
jgi:hypothetical protein